MKLLLKISIVTLFLITFLPVHAQVPSSIDGVLIQVSTDNPVPGKTVTISIQSYNFDLNAASIVWLVDGKVKLQGVGEKEFDVIAPKVGTDTIVSVKIKGADGREVQKEVTIRSSYTDIIWESNGYKPPFFEGKLPFSYQNDITLIAMPHLAKTRDTEIDPKTLIYSWKNDGKYIDGAQGYGRQSVTVIADNIPKTLTVTVDITNREQTIHTTGSLTLAPSQPTLAFYEEDPLYGILFNKAIKEKITMKNREMKVLAIPYGFNLTKNSNTYGWSVNNVDQDDLTKNRSITIRTQGDSAGSSNVDLDIRNLDKILQGAQGGFTVYFNKVQSTEEPSL